ncbi:MAG: PAS domain S-box protein, partial [Nitrospirota bacterium]
MRFPCKYKLISIILVILIPMVIFSIYHYFEMLGHNKEVIRSNNLAIAKNIAKELDELVNKSLDVLYALSRHPAVIAKNSKECNRLFAELLTLYPLHLNIVAADMHGNIYGSGVYSRDAMKINCSDKEWFTMASKGKIIVGDIHISRLFKVPASMIAVPVFDKGKKQVGVIGFPLNLSKIRDKLTKASILPDKSTIDVIDSKGNILICSNPEEKFCKENIGPDFLKRGIEREEINEEKIGIDGIKRLFSISSMSDAGWAVIVGIPTQKAYRHAYSVSRNYILILLIVGLAALTMSLLFSAKITKNLSFLVAGMKEIEQDNLNFKLKLSGNDELQDVAESFNRMTERRRKVEEKIKESEAFLSSVLEGIGEGVVVIDRDFKIISANKGYCDQVKKSCDDIIGKHCYEVSHHSDKPCFEIENECECTVKQCFETGEHHRAIHIHYDKGGNQVFIETNAYPLKDPSGNIVSAIETLKDVTDRIKLEKQLEEVKERYRKLYDEAPDMMHSVDKDGLIILCNKTEAEILGYSIDELVGKHVSEILAPESRRDYSEKFKLHKDTGFFEGERIFLAKDGRYVPVFMRAKAMYDDNGDFLMNDVVSRDITEKKALEAQLRHAQKMEAVGQLAGGIAHDFNNILTAIIGYGNLLHTKLEENNLLKHYVDQILSASERASKL